MADECSTYRAIGSLLSRMASGPAAQADVDVVNYVEELFDNCDFSKWLNTNFL